MPARRRCCAARQAPPARARRWTRYAADYPNGPHDQPQSMCPAFGSLRVGLRMRRTATILSGSACCVYGLTFTSHFYGARRTVGYVPFNSETLVTGKLFEDIRDAVFKLAEPAIYDAIVIINLCVPDRLGRAAAICCRRRSTASASSASTCRASACRPMRKPRTCWPAPCCAMRGRRPSRAPCRRRAQARQTKPDGHAARRDVPGRSRAASARMLEPLGLAAGPVVPTREWRELYAALDCAAVAAVHPFYTASHPRVRSAPAARSSAPRPVGVDGTAAWLDAIGEACGVSPGQDRRRQERGSCRRSGRRWRPIPIKAPHHRLGLRGLGIAGGAAADRERRRRALCRHRLPAHADGRIPTASGWRPRASHVQYRASLEQDLAAMQRVRSRTSPSARRRWCRRPRSWRSRRSTSPTSSRPGRCSARPAPVRSPGSSTRAIAGREPLRRDGRFLRRRRRRATPPAMAGRDVPTDRARPPQGRNRKARVRATCATRWGLSDAGPRPRPGRRLLGRGLCLHRHQGPAGRDRRPGRLREPAGHGGAALHRWAAAARAAGRRDRAWPRKSSAQARHRGRHAARASATHDPDLPAVVVTGSIAEMIGGGVTPEGTNIQRFLPRTIDEDQWQARDRALFWLWTEFGAKKARAASARPRSGGREAARQHHRPDLRHVQHAVRPRRDPAAGRGHRLRGQHGLPARQPSRRRRRSSSTPTSTSACTASSAASCARRWSGPTCRRRSGCFATTKFLRTLGELLGLDPEPFIEREKHTTIKPIWDLWRW